MNLNNYHIGYLIFILSLSATSLFGQEVYNNNLKPYKVWQAKRVTVFNYNAVKLNKKIIKQGLIDLFVSNNSKEYDVNGKIIKFISYNKFGGVDFVENYKYDPLYNLVERYLMNATTGDTVSKSLMYYKDTLLVKQLDYQLIIDTNILDSIVFKIDLIGERNYLYNSKKELIQSEYKSFHTYPEKNIQIRYDYNELGKVIKIINSSFDSIEYIRKIEYNQKGNIILEKEFNSSGDLFSYRKLEYNETSELVKEQRKNSPIDKEITYVYKYIGEDIVGIESISETFKSNRKYEYLYDEFGNWIQRIEDNGGDSYVVTERKIEY